MNLRKPVLVGWPIGWNAFLVPYRVGSPGSYCVFCPFCADGAPGLGLAFHESLGGQIAATLLFELRGPNSAEGRRLPWFGHGIPRLSQRDAHLAIILIGISAW
tara:strand:- start:1671 stop:1979 length:309 start_codon:yes stop_codon:yes gene_type:complete